MILKSLEQYSFQRDFFKIIIFDFLIGNTDRHQNNWAIIQSDKSTRLCPIYDNGSSQCYAKVLTVPPNVKYSEKFVQLQQEARENHRGLWGLEQESSANQQVAAYIGSTRSMKFHRPDCKWGQKIASSNRIVFNSREAALEQGYVPCKVCGP